LATNSALKNIVVGFDNRALITTSLTTSGTTAPYLYDPPSGIVQALSSYALNNATPAMTANGASAIVIQGDPTLTSDVAVFSYTTATNQLTTIGQPLRQNTAPPVVSRNSNRIVLNATRVFDVNLSPLGTLASTTNAVVLKPDGTRAYAYDATAGGILIYDISVDREEAAYVALGAATPLGADPGSNVRIAITPDGGTLFVAGSSRIVVLPTPAG